LNNNYDSHQVIVNRNSDFILLCIKLPNLISYWKI